jgi:hypothetical protein
MRAHGRVRIQRGRWRHWPGQGRVNGAIGQVAARCEWGSGGWCCIGDWRDSSGWRGFGFWRLLRFGGFRGEVGRAVVGPDAVGNFGGSSGGRLSSDGTPVLRVALGTHSGLQWSVWLGGLGVAHAGCGARGGAGHAGARCGGGGAETASAPGTGVPGAERGSYRRIRSLRWWYWPSLAPVVWLRSGVRPPCRRRRGRDPPRGRPLRRVSRRRRSPGRRRGCAAS